jgi:predicted acylesterase/phospholipase RssA
MVQEIHRAETITAPPSPRILFVLSGGGLPGLDIHCGIWGALVSHGIEPTDCHGTSAGAIVALLQASGMDRYSFCSLLRSLKDKDVRKERVAWKLRIPFLDYWIDPEPIRVILEGFASSSYQNLRKGLACWAADYRTGSAVNAARPEIFADPAQAALASMSISGVFPPQIGLDGVPYIDGGIRRNLPLPANWRDYDHVYLCIASPQPRDYSLKGGILTHLIRNLQIAMYDQIRDPLDETAGAQNVTVLWPDVHTAKGFLHFDHSLIERAFAATLVALSSAKAKKGQP